MLLTHLEYTFGIYNTTLAWFKSYMYGRFKQRLSTIRNPILSNFPVAFCSGACPFTLYTTPLTSIINRHNLNHHFYADDTQLRNSALPENINTLLKTTSDCYSDIKN